MRLAQAKDVTLGPDGTLVGAGDLVGGAPAMFDRLAVLEVWGPAVSTFPG